MKKLLFIIICLGVLALTAQERNVTQNQIPNANNRTSISVSSMANGITAIQMVETILGQGVSYSNVTYSGVPQAGGVFTNGTPAGLGISSGIILSSGSAIGAIGPNTYNGYSANNNSPGDTQLSALVGGSSTHDACILEFDFVPQSHNIQFNFILGSEEYPEYLQYHDVFGFFLDGVNIALLPGTTTPISIGTINHLTNSGYYVSNTPAVHDIQCDGYTVILPVMGVVTPKQTHHIKLAVADMGDYVYDTWIFLEQNSFVSGADVSLIMNPPPVFNPNSTNTYSFIVANDGPSKAQNIVAQIRLPYTFEHFTTSTSTGFVWEDENLLTWDVGSLGQGYEATLQVTASGLAYQSLSFAGYVTSDVFDPQSGNNYFPLHHAPVANSDSYQTDEDIPLNIGYPQGLLANDLSYSAMPSECVVVSSPLHASAFSVSCAGGFSYTPTLDYSGFDSFTYYFNDGSGGVSNHTTVTIQIANIIDLPTINLPSYASFIRGNPLVINTMPYISNVNFSHAILSLAGNQDIQAEINGFTVTFNCIGYDCCETVTFTVYDSLQGLSASDQILIEALPAMDCYGIQYTAYSNGISPYNGSQVTVEGLVTAVGMEGFFIADSGNGLYRGLYIQTDYAVQTQDLVLVMGTVNEVNGFTKLANVTKCIVVAQAQDLPEPLVISPLAVASEAYEGVLCQIQNVTISTAPNANQVFTVSNTNGICQIDDGYFYANEHTWSNIISGQLWQSITGIVTSRDGQFYLNPRSSEDMIVAPYYALNLLITHSNGSINLSWSPLPYTSLYTIYHAAHPTGAWTILETTNETTLSLTPTQGCDFYYVTGELQP